MSNLIKVKVMTDESIEILKNSPKGAFGLLKENDDNSWLSDFCPQPLYKEKAFEIEDFSLNFDIDSNYSKVDYSNSVLLYERLKHLPRYLLTDEKFWAWINFEKGYKAAKQAIPLKDKLSAFTDHWLFASGERRGNFFGVLSRCYFRIELSYDESNQDPYHLSKFVVENPERFRNLTWRTFSSQKKIVLGALKAEKRILEDFGGDEKTKLYREVASFIAKLGSVKVIDLYSEEDIQKEVYNFLREKIKDKQ
jgi:hypothetical protein